MFSAKIRNSFLKLKRIDRCFFVYDDQERNKGFAIAFGTKNFRTPAIKWVLTNYQQQDTKRKRKTFIQKQIEHPFSLGNINIISDKNAVYEKEIVLVRVQIWLPQLVVFFLVNRTFLWLFLAVFREGHDSPLGQESVCIVFHRRYEWCFLEDCTRWWSQDELL